VSGSGISWAICKSAPLCRQITTPAPHHSVFCRPDALPGAQPKCQSTKGTSTLQLSNKCLFVQVFSTTTDGHMLDNDTVTQNLTLPVPPPVVEPTGQPVVKRSSLAVIIVPVVIGFVVIVFLVIVVVCVLHIRKYVPFLRRIACVAKMRHILWHSDPGIQGPGDPVDPVTLFYNELQMSTYVADKRLQWARGLPVFIAVWRLHASGK